MAPPEKAKSEEFYASDQRVQTLLADRTRFADEIDKKRTRRLELAQELGVSSFTDNFLEPCMTGSCNSHEAEADASSGCTAADATGSIR